MIGLVLAVLMQAGTPAAQEAEIIVPGPAKPSAQTPATMVLEPVAMFIAACDEDGDGRTDRAELSACVDRSFRLVDTGSTGRMRYLIFADWAQRFLGDRNALPSPFDADKDSDNRITLPELQAHFSRLFSRFDRDRDGAISRAEALIRANEADPAKRRGFSEEEIRDVAEAVGIGAVKYADLSQNRQSDYIFSWDRMLALEGNTAPYLMYAYARIRSIYRKGQVEGGAIERSPISLDHPAEQEPAAELRVGAVDTEAPTGGRLRGVHPALPAPLGQDARQDRVHDVQPGGVGQDLLDRAICDPARGQPVDDVAEAVVQAQLVLRDQPQHADRDERLGGAVERRQRRRRVLLVEVGAADRHVEQRLVAADHADLGGGVEEALVSLTLEAFDEVGVAVGHQHGSRRYPSGRAVPIQAVPACSASSARATAETWISSVPA